MIDIVKIEILVSICVIIIGGGFEGVVGRMCKKLLCLWVFVVLIIIVFLWMILMFGLFILFFCLCDDIQLSGWWMFFVDFQVMLENYVDVLQFGMMQLIILELFVNLIVIIILVMIILLMIVLMVVYVFVWIDFKGCNVLFIFVFVLQIVLIQMVLVLLFSLFL